MKEIEIDDISELFTKENSNNGVWLHPIIFGKKYKFEVLVFGDDCDEVQEMSRQKLREMRKKINISNKKGISIDDDDDSLFDDDGVDDILARFGGIRKSEGEPLKFGEDEIPIIKTKESEQIYRNILVGMDELQDWIRKESKDRSNFLSKGKKN